MGGQTCGKHHTQHRCFSRLDDAWRAEFGDEVEHHLWAELLRSGVAIFDLDYDAIISAMYALSSSAEVDCYRCVPPDPGIEAAALGASESSLPGTTPDEALHTFTLDSGASRCFFSDSTTLTPLPALVPVRMADPSRGPVVACSSSVLPCPAHWSLPPLPPLPALPCLPCVEGQQGAAPHSSSFPPTTAPLQTLHMDMWGPARVSEQGRERYFLLVVNDYTRYTTVFPLRSKGQAVDVLIPWIRAVHLQLRERFGQDLPVLRLHSDRGGEFSSDLLQDFCHGEGILQSFTLPGSPQQNGIAECRIGLVQEVAHTSMIHAAAPHFLWTFAVRYAAHQLNLWPRVSLPETSPTLRWTGEVGDALVFRVWGSRAFVRDSSTEKLSARAIPCAFLGFPPDAPCSQFYHPTSHHVFPSQDVPFDESVPFYHLFPYRSAPPLPPPLFLAPGPPPVDPLLPQGPAPSGVSQVDPLPGTVHVEVAGDSGAARGTVSGGAESGGAEPGGTILGVAEPEGVEPGGADSEGADSGGAKPRGAALSGGPAGASPWLSPRPERLSLQQLHEVTAGAGGTGGAAATAPGGACTGGTEAARTDGVEGAGAGDPTEPGVARAGGTGAGGTGSSGAGAGDTGTGGAGAGGAGAVDPGVGGAGVGGAGGTGAGGTVRPLPYFVPLLQQVLGTPSSTSLSPPLLYPPPDQSQPPLRPASPLPTPSPYTEKSASQSHCLSSLAIVVTDPSFESTAASALVAELLDFAAACRLDFATALVAESESASPPSVGGECALGTDVLEDRQEDFECLAAAVPRFASMLLAPEGDPDAPDIPTPRSYAEAITFDGMWIFRVKRPSGSPPAFKARYVSRGFSQRQRVDYFQTFSPTPKMTTLRVPREWHNTLRTTLAALGFAPSIADPSLFLRTDTSLPPFYVLVYVDDLVFAIADTEALTLVKSELQKRHTYSDLGELRSYLGLKTTRDRERRTITLNQSHMVHQVLQRFGFQFSSPQPTPLSTDLSLSTPPSDESVEPSDALGCCEEGTALLVQYLGHGARAWRTGSSCPH
ncbi:unnamed protein product [Closterium sp. NIES-54]